MRTSLSICISWSSVVCSNLLHNSIELVYLLLVSVHSHMSHVQTVQMMEVGNVSAINGVQQTQALWTQSVAKGPTARMHHKGNRC